jgi:DNA-binding XRE family transcriptional regulator
LTVDQHTDHISKGQLVSRHTLPTLLYFLFSPPHIFFNSILANRTNGTFGFARHTSRPFAKPKEPFFANAQTDRTTIIQTLFISKNEIVKILNLSLRTHFKNDMNRIKEVLEEKGVKQTWLAEQLGKSYNMVNGYVQNRQQPRLEVLFEIAKILGVKPTDLIKDKK